MYSSYRCEEVQGVYKAFIDHCGAEEEVPLFGSSEEELSDLMEALQEAYDNGETDGYVRKSGEISKVLGL